MDNKLGNYKATLPGSEDRFAALEEVQMLLKSRRVNLEHLFDILFKSDDGSFDFNFGDILIQFVRGFAVWSERKDVVQVAIELQKGDEKEWKAVAFEYTLDDLKAFNATKMTKTG